MSQEPNKPVPSRGNASPKPLPEGTESDLWDFDSEDSGNHSPYAERDERSEGLPARRTNDSNLSSKKPTERSTDVPNVSPARQSAEVEPTEQSLAEDMPVAVGTIDSASIESTTIQPAAAPPAPSESGDDGSPEASNSLSSYTKTERIAVAALFGALILAATLAVIFFTTRIPTRSPFAEKPHFPVSGKLVEIRSADTYWRKPVTTGDNPDTVRRDTALIPIVRLSLHSSAGAIRVFFRNDEGVVIGDAINRNVSGDQEIVIAATAGFNDIGMHAAYRTGEQEPWTVQIYEGSSASADRKDFHKVLDTQISTDIR